MYTKFRDSSMSSKSYWEEYAQNYDHALHNEYHGERLKMIGTLLDDLDMDKANVLDFGCGNGDLMLSFKALGARVSGIDVSENMIELAAQNFKEKKVDANLVVGGVEDLEKYEENQFDIITCFNVLAYLTLEEEVQFYKACERILANNGQLVITHSNELFDMFTLNAFTYNFHKNHFVGEEAAEGMKNLLPKYNVPEIHGNFKVRANPLNYAKRLEVHQFKEVQQEFCHYHKMQPLLLESEHVFEPVPKYDETDKWKLMFTCSIYGTRLILSK